MLDYIRRPKTIATGLGFAMLLDGLFHGLLAFIIKKGAGLKKI